jgi:hypothetical protein
MPVASTARRVFSERSTTLRENISMIDEASLLPPIRVINERLTRNQRERRRLRTLLRLALEVNDECRRRAPATPQPAAAREGVSRE